MHNKGNFYVTSVDPSFKKLHTRFTLQYSLNISGSNNVVFYALKINYDDVNRTLWMERIIQIDVDSPLFKFTRTVPLNREDYSNWRWQSLWMERIIQIYFKSPFKCRRLFQFTLTVPLNGEDYSNLRWQSL